jgi:hypothetical protein
MKQLIYSDSYCAVVFLGIFRFTVSMYQTIHEQVRVAGIFNHSSFKPVWFEWSQRMLKIQDITLVSNYKQGLVKSKIYSVVAEGNVYRLTFDLVTLDWTLESVWIDG